MDCCLEAPDPAHCITCGATLSPLRHGPGAIECWNCRANPEPLAYVPACPRASSLSAALLDALAMAPPRGPLYEALSGLSTLLVAQIVAGEDIAAEDEAQIRTGLAWLRRQARPFLAEAV